MPVASYLAYPKPGMGRKAAGALAALPGCTVSPSTEYSLLVIVTDTPNEQIDRELQISMRAVPELDGLAMVFCHDDSDQTGENRP